MTDPLDSLLDPLPPLRPTAGDARLRRQLDGVTVEAVCGGRAPVDATAAQACLAGLWLGHGFLDESHRISQEIDTPEGSWWHGIRTGSGCLRLAEPSSRRCSFCRLLLWRCWRWFLRCGLS
jgi:hypothetical protein